MCKHSTRNNSHFIFCRPLCDKWQKSQLITRGELNDALEGINKRSIAVLLFDTYFVAKYCLSISPTSADNIYWF